MTTSSFRAARHKKIVTCQKCVECVLSKKCGVTDRQRGKPEEIHQTLGVCVCVCLANFPFSGLSKGKDAQK